MYKSFKIHSFEKLFTTNNVSSDCISIHAITVKPLNVFQFWSENRFIAL